MSMYVVHWHTSAHLPAFWVAGVHVFPGGVPCCHVSGQPARQSQAEFTAAILVAIVAIVESNLLHGI